MDSETLKILNDSRIIRERFPNKVYKLFQSTKNIDYLTHILNSKYSKLTATHEYRSKEAYFVDFYTKVHKFWIPIADRSFYTDINVWDAVKILNTKFIKHACQHIEFKYDSKKSKSYTDVALDETILYQPGFEDLNRNIVDTRKWGREHLDPYKIIKTAEEDEAEYYGYEYVTSDVAIKLKQKTKNKPHYTYPVKGTPFMINRKPKINMWHKFNNASAGAEMEAPRDTEGTYEMETPIYGHKFPAKYNKHNR
jgi:hypothetical protein